MSFSVLSLADSAAWDEAVRSVPDWDLYWHPGYAGCWEANGDGEAFLALLDEGGERAVQVFLRRPVPFADPPLWDIATPYGYGGPLATPGGAPLMERLQAELAAYCRSTDILSEFVRYHPLVRNAPPDATLRGPTVYLDLQAGEPWDGFKAEVRNRVRKSEKAGLTVRLTEAPPSVTAFARLYRETMARRQAAPWYLFSDDTFASLLQGLRPHVLLAEAMLDGRVVAAALFLFNATYLHYHLGGSAAEALPLAPNNRLFAEAARWGRDRGIRLMHLGGGMRPGDSLLRFKGGFSPLRAEFRTGQRIYDARAYAALERAHRERLGSLAPAPGWFPAYRAPAQPAGEGEEGR